MSDIKKIKEYLPQASKRRFEIDYFNHPYAKYLANYNTCELTKPQRYDMPLWNWLEDFYEVPRELCTFITPEEFLVKK
jgi:hypothetical protein